jgi:hypothetical protein
MADSASIFDQANKPGVALANPLDTYQKAGAVNYLMNQNKRFQADQAAGQATLNALNPDGSWNQAALGAGLQANPASALAAGDALTRGQAQQGQQQTQGLQRNAAIVNATTAALKAPLGQMHDVVAAQVQRLIDTGVVPRAEGMATLAKLPNDEASLRPMLEQYRISLLPPGQQQPAIYGTPGTVTGPNGNQIGTMQQPQTGAVSVPQQAGAPQGLSPEAASTPTPLGVTSTGAPITGTRKQFVIAAQPAAPAAAGGGGNPLLGGAKNPVPGSADNNPAWPGQTESAPGDYKATPPLPAGIVTGQGPGEIAAATTNATQSAEGFKGVSDQGVAAQSRGAVLDNMLADTSQFTTGPGADVIARIRAVAQRLGANVNTDGLTAAESFKKLMSQLNGNQGSDARLAVSEASNPHADLSPGGVDLMLRQLRGNEDYNMARAKLAAAYPNRADKTGFEAKIGSQLDPRVFQYNRLQPAQKAKYFDSLPDKGAFMKSYDTANTLLAGGQ